MSGVENIGTQQVIWVLQNFLAFGLPWIFLLAMTVAWVKDVQLSRAWPVLGTISGMVSLLFSGGWGLFFAPTGILLAVHLVSFHMRHSKGKPTTVGHGVSQIE